MGQIAVTAGDITLTSGDATLTDGDFVMSEGKVSITDTSDETILALSSAATTGSDITLTSSITSGECIKVTADALASGGDMLLLDSDGIPSGAYFIRCYDGSADDFSVANGGTVTTTGAINIAADSTNLTFGLSGATDSYIQFDGSHLVFYDSSLGATRTLSQLAAIDSLQ